MIGRCGLTVDKKDRALILIVYYGNSIDKNIILVPNSSQGLGTVGENLRKPGCQCIREIMAAKLMAGCTRACEKTKGVHAFALTPFLRYSLATHF